MKIAQVSPLYESVPPKLYGGTERVVHWLVEELVRQGHEVTLFASGDSVTSARLVAPCPAALRLDGTIREPLAHHFVMLDQVFEAAETFETGKIKKDAMAAIEELKTKGSQKSRDFAWWGQVGQTALALGCVGAAAGGMVALGIPCVVGGAVSFG